MTQKDLLGKSFQTSILLLNSQKKDTIHILDCQLDSFGFYVRTYNIPISAIFNRANFLPAQPASDDTDNIKANAS